MIETILYIFVSIQVMYFYYLIVTNTSATLLVFSSFNRLLRGYISHESYLRKRIISSNAYRPVSIIVPAYNEEATIEDCVHSFLSLQFPEFEVIVVNDGSKDDTMRILIERFELQKVPTPPLQKLNHQPIRQIYKSGKYPNLIVVDKFNGGKSDALNAGIALSNYPLFCCVDADSLLEESAVIRAMEHFIKDRDVIAVGGAISVVNGSKVEGHTVVEKRLPKKLIESFQALEYVRGFLAGRIGWEVINGLLIVSGAYGVFRKDIVMQVGGYRHAVGEDFDLLIRMRKYCYDNKIKHNVKFIADPMCWTQAPSDYSSLLKQRNRWHRGLLETTYYNAKMLFNPRYGVVGLLSLPYYILIEGLGPVITFVGVISLIVLYMYGAMDYRVLIAFFLLEFVWGISLNILSLILDLFSEKSYHRTRDLIALVGISFLEPFFFRPLLKMEQFIASFNFFNTNWGEIKRSAIK